jgi:hypothetical protein
MGSICVAVTIITAIIGTAALMLINRKRPERVPLEPRFDQFG